MIIINIKYLSFNLLFFRAVAHLGDLNLDPTVDDGSRPIDIPITRVITHERYNAQEYTNDIALLKLENNVRFNRKDF